MSSETAAIERARRALGTRFLLHGRRPAEGLDCVGLIAWAHGRAEDAPMHYSLRMASAARWKELLDQLGEARCGPLLAGDVLLMQAGPGQLHLGLWTGEGLIHADAGLRRIVETPGQPAWPILGQWRFAQGAMNDGDFSADDCRRRAGRTDRGGSGCGSGPIA